MAATDRDITAERTEQPTPLRLAEARRRGTVARSAALTGAVLLLATLAALVALAPRMLEGLRDLMAVLLDGGNTPLATPGESLALLARHSLPVLAGVVVLALAAVATALLVGMAQVGMFATAEPLKPDFGRLSPAQGLRRMFSARSLIRLGFTLVRMAVVGGVLVLAWRRYVPMFAGASLAPVWALTQLAGEIVWFVALRIGVAMLAIAALDYLYQRWQHRHDLRMTRREVLEDMRRMEGNPQMRLHMRQLARRHGGQWAHSGVGRSSLVVVAAALAVAIRIDAPGGRTRLSIKGAGRDAATIRQAARRLGVRCAHDDSLARRLWPLRTGQVLPADLDALVGQHLRPDAGPRQRKETA